ncbi:hypothetical protein PTKIN_Ptkin16aG0068600 [Pterospermum kingtungense]
MPGSDVALKTICEIENDTGLDVHNIDHKDWAGLGPAPDIIPEKKSGHFTHTADYEGSIGADVYQGVLEYRWIVAWSNKPIVNNQAYTKILEPGDQYIWDDIKNKLSQAPNTGTDSIGDFSSYVVIDITGSSPSFTAWFKYATK